jgi:uncharacterized delta-60 repeat protein
MGRPSNRTFAALTVLVALASTSAFTSGAAAAAHGRPGALDPSFGNQGHVLVKPPMEPAPAEFAAAAREPDGDIVLELRHSSPTEEAVREIEMRKPSGAFDPSFGQGGLVKAPAGYGLTTLPNGDIVVGAINCGGEPSSAMELDPEGNAVPGFGTDGCGPAIKFSERLIAVDGQGRIVLVGTVQFCSPCGKDILPRAEPVVARLLPNGSLDPAFGKGGIVYTHGEDGLEIGYGQYAEPRLVAPTADGGVVINLESRLIRLTESGTLDAAFGGTGTVDAPGPLEAILAEPDGGIVVAGGPSKGPAAVSKLGPSGALDQSFGDAGTQRLSLPSGSRLDQISAVPEGGILVAGLKASGAGCAACQTPFLARLSAAGQLDSGYGEGGFADLAAATAPNPVSDLQALAVGKDGSLLLAGSRRGGDAVALLRKSTGAAEPSFGEGGSLVEHHEEAAQLASTGLAARAGGGARLLTERYNQPGNPFGWLADFGSGGGQRAFSDGAPAVESRPHGAIVPDGGGRFVSIETDPPKSVRSVHGIGRDGKTWKKYGTNGRAEFPPDFEAKELLPAPGGGIAIVGAFRGREMAVLRLGPTGHPVPGFGHAGLAKVRFAGAAAVAFGGVVEADGDVVVTGSAGNRLAVARLLPDGNLDPGFGRHGLARLGRGTTGAFATPLRGGVVIATQRQRYGPPPFAGLVRLDRHGHLVKDFGHGGIVKSAERLPFALLTVAGRIVLVIDPEFEKNNRGAALELRSYRPDGRVDRAFGDHGVTYFGRGGESGLTFSPAAAVAQPGGKVMVAGTVRDWTKPTGRHTEAELLRFLVG